MEYLYRYTDEMRCGVSLTEWGGENYYTTGPYLRLEKYPIIKRTPCGAWIATGCIIHKDESIDSAEKRFVNLQATKRFACETEEDALVSFRARKRRQIQILKDQLWHAEKALLVAESLSAVAT